MARVIKLFSNLFQRLWISNGLGSVNDLPLSIRKDIGLPADPDPPFGRATFDRFL